MHLVIEGRVQGVGYRAWTEMEATKLSLSGWVRNRRDGSVEATVSGPETAVHALIRDCWTGPTLARVTAVRAQPSEPPETSGFRMLPTL